MHCSCCFARSLLTKMTVPSIPGQTATNTRTTLLSSSLSCASLAHCTDADEDPLLPYRCSHKRLSRAVGAKQRSSDFKPPERSATYPLSLLRAEYKASEPRLSFLLPSSSITIPAHAHYHKTMSASPTPYDLILAGRWGNPVAGSPTIRKSKADQIVSPTGSSCLEVFPIQSQTSQSALSSWSSTLSAR